MAELQAAEWQSSAALLPLWDGRRVPVSPGDTIEFYETHERILPVRAMRSGHEIEAQHDARRDGPLDG